MAGGISGDIGYVLVKGSHDYQTKGTFDITVSVIGPGGQTATAMTATATVAPMPDSASQPISVPKVYSGPEPLGYESLNLVPDYSVPSYVGVGFSLNPVTEIEGTYNGQADDTVSDYKAQINWGDGTTWDPNTSLVAGGTSGDIGYVLVKGTHIYKQQGTYDIVVYVTGPDGQTISDQTATATVVPMPEAASQPITVPKAYSGAKPLGYESLSLVPDYSVSSYVGVSSNLSSVTEIEGTYNGQADGIATDFKAQINWGDGTTWDTDTSLVAEGTSGDIGYVLVKGAHVYKAQGSYDIVVYVTGPDGQTISDQTATATVVPNPNAINVGSLSPSQWQENEHGYDGTISVSGGSGGYQNLQVSGLPSGLSATIVSSVINGQQSGTITISGTPTESGTFTLTTTVEDGDGDTGDGTESLKITSTPVVLGSVSPQQWTVSQPSYHGSISVSGGTGDYEDLQVTGLPPGLNSQLSGNVILITGTPTTSGSFTSLDVSVQDSSATNATGTYSLTINPAITMGDLSPDQWQVNEPGYDGTIAVHGGTGSYSDLQVSGLPAGLTATIESSTVTVGSTPTLSGTIFITGTPTQSGVFTGGVSLRDATGALDPTYKLSITESTPPPALEVTLQQIEQIIPAPPAPPASPPTPPKAGKGKKVTAAAKKAYAKKLAAYNTAVSKSEAYPTLAAGLVDFLNSSDAIVTDQINTRKRQAAFIGQVAVESGYLTTLPQSSLFGTVKGTTPGYGYLQITGTANDQAAAKYLNESLSQTIDLMATNTRVAADVSGWYWKGGSGVPGINQYADAWDITSVSKLVNSGSLYKYVKNAKGKVIKKLPGPVNNLQQRIDYSNAALDVLQ